MITEMLQNTDNFLKTNVHNQTEIDENAASEMLRLFKEQKQDDLNEDLDKTLKDIIKHAESIQKLNEKLKKELGAYKQIKEDARSIIWTCEFITDSYK